MFSARLVRGTSAVGSPPLLSSHGPGPDVPPCPLLVSTPAPGRDSFPISQWSVPCPVPLVSVGIPPPPPPRVAAFTICLYWWQNDNGGNFWEPWSVWRLFLPPVGAGWLFFCGRTAGRPPEGIGRVSVRTCAATDLREKKRDSRRERYRDTCVTLMFNSFLLVDLNIGGQEGAWFTRAGWLVHYTVDFIIRYKRG